MPIKLLLFVVAGLLFALYLTNNDFDTGYHMDEPKKVRFIKGDYQDYHHPLLLLQSSRLAISIANLFTPGDETVNVLRMGRSVSALYALLAWFFSYLLFARLMSKWEALLVSVVAAVTPIMVVHAHYLKEDTFLVAGVYAALWAYVAALESGKLKYWLILGVTLGFAFSSHYKSSMLIPILGLLPVIKHHTIKLDVYKKLTASMLLSGVVFCGINYPIFYEFDTFIEGMKHEQQQSVSGHDIFIPFQVYWFSFHFLKSIVPGVSLFLAVPGLIGLIFFTSMSIKKGHWKTTVLVLTVLIFYTVVELSPKKPYPDFIRYVMPLMPAYIALAYLFIRYVGQRLLDRQPFAIAAVCLGVLGLYPLYDSVMLTYYLNKDTRGKILDVMADKAPRETIMYEGYAHPTMGDMWSINDINLQRAPKRGIQYAVVSSFSYDRYLDIVKYRDLQADWVVSTMNKYLISFEKLPYEEIKPAYKSFAFSNPTIRIIDLRDAETILANDENK